MWDLPGPEIKPVSPALHSRFLTTGAPEKSLPFLLYVPPCLDSADLDNAGDNFNAQAIPGLCLHWAPVGDKDNASSVVTICAGMGESQERSQGWDKED